MKKSLFFMFFSLSLTGFAQIRLELMGGFNDVNLSTLGRLPFSANHFSEGEYVPITSFHAGAATTIALGKKWFRSRGQIKYGTARRLFRWCINCENYPHSSNFPVVVSFLTLPAWKYRPFMTTYTPGGNACTKASEQPRLKNPSELPNV